VPECLRAGAREALFPVDTIVGNTDTTLKAALEQAADAIMLTELSVVIQYVNAAFERVSGYARSEVLGRHVRLLKSGHTRRRSTEPWMTPPRASLVRGFVNCARTAAVRIRRDSPVRSMAAW
jgi:PAS domain-containing protein